MVTNFLYQKKILAYIVFSIPLILHINTIPNNYTLDDAIVVTENNYVKEGIHGLGKIFTNESFTGFFAKKKDLVEGGRYRPLSIASYAIEYSLWKNNPHISHFLNDLLYAILCLLAFILVQKIVAYLGEESIAVPVAFFCVVLFAFHPLHTEVVANIKGRDEMLAFLFSLITLYLLLLYLEKGRLWYAIASGFTLFLGLLSKENALTMIPVAVLLFTLNYKKRLLPKYLLLLFFLFSGVAFYLSLRTIAGGTYSLKVQDEIMNNPYLFASGAQKITTILYTSLLYLKLLIIPYPLTYDYYPFHIRFQTWQNPWVLLSALIYFLMLFTAFRYFNKRKIISFSICFYIICLIPVSNILINIGSFMNERFLFFSSFGFCLLSGYIFFYLLQNHQNSGFQRTITIIGFTTILVFFGVITLQRNTQWKDNYTLFLHDVNISTESAKGNCAAGGILLETAEKENNPGKKSDEYKRSLAYLTKAVTLYPKYVDALLLLGNVYYLGSKDFNKSISCYAEIFSISPTYDLAYSNLKKVLASTDNPVIRQKGYNVILKYNPADFEATYQLGLVYGKNLNKMDSAVMYLSRAVEINPNKAEANRDCGIAYAMNGNAGIAIPYFKKAIQLEPLNPSNYINLGITYQKMGNVNEASELFKKAEELKRKP
jgi:protein O-mannosyl-transferase